MRTSAPQRFPWFTAGRLMLIYGILGLPIAALGGAALTWGSSTSPQPEDYLFTAFMTGSWAMWVVLYRWMCTLQKISKWALSASVLFPATILGFILWLLSAGVFPRVLVATGVLAYTTLLCGSYGWSLFRYYTAGTRRAD